tara:strand:+ start:1420 stop:1701 length:282 start_codon:yes stop_codon:yes gene_type:complete
MNVLKKEINEIQSSFNLNEILKRIVKYLIEGAAVAAAAFYFPNPKLPMEQVVTIAMTAAATFALLDLFAPSVGNFARQGSGFGIGAGLVGFPR